MSTRLRVRAARLMRQLEAGAGYREQIERELTQRLSQSAPGPKDPAYARGTDSAYARGADPVGPPVCEACATPNDADARFCKTCGGTL